MIDHHSICFDEVKLQSVFVGSRAMNSCLRAPYLFLRPVALYSLMILISVCSSRLLIVVSNRKGRLFGPEGCKYGKLQSRIPERKGDVES